VRHRPLRTHDRSNPNHIGVGAASTRRRAALIATGVAALLTVVGVVAFIGARLGQPQSTPVTPSPSSTLSALPPPESQLTGSPEPPNTPSQPSQPSNPPAPPTHGKARPPGDLGLAQPISQPACNGQLIVILGSVTTPGLYAAGVQQLLDAHPGAFYLRTDQTCPSLRPATAEGNPIYAVFELGGTTQSQVCARVHAAGDSAYGKRLDTTTDPGYIIPCPAH
jgi:serine/threonine protein kinase, bacterial